jgi:DNA-directed RNA polymerase subunit alpha
MEDVVNFEANLKKVRFNSEASEPQVLKLKVKGKKDIVAGDIENTALVQVINKDLKLGTLTDKKAEIDMELTIEKGLGYVPAEEKKEKRLPIGTIMLDCVYSPVKNVNFYVEEMRVGERTDYNRVKLIIETDGSVSPSVALHKSANILRDHFAIISGIHEIEDENFELSKDEDSSIEKPEVIEKEEEKSKEGSLICDICGFEAKSERGLRSHITRQHS